ncbi:MAG: DUF4389 domain-containing protein [Mariprofundaceae bacterium]|nr:DUF4389 domain-containing protein [Mariprofundaceae bacterium]
MEEHHMADELKEHVKDSSVWLRLLFMGLFALLYWVAEAVLAVVVLFQFFSVLFTGKKSGKVLSFGAQLSTYAYQIFRYLTYNSEEKPYPLGDWPSDSVLVTQVAEAPKPKSRAAPRKRAVKKAAPKPEAETEQSTN